MSAVTGPPGRDDPADALPTLDPLAFPLSGSHLIEASAGTGKTWTIAALYTRLVLGHGGQPARLPADMLVLTFTDAAAAELRDRIRARLSAAARVFASGSADGVPDADPFLTALCADYAGQGADAPADCARLLDLAAQSMDEAAISTIHAWCYRVLREHAFESGQLFEQRLEPDLGVLNRQVKLDYWRACVARLDGAALEAVLSIWDGPDALPLPPTLAPDATWPEPSQSLAEVCAQVDQARATRLEALKAPWVQGIDAWEAWFDSLGKSYGPPAHHRRRWLEGLRQWAHTPEAVFPELKKGWERLSSEALAQSWKGEGPPPRHPLGPCFDALQPALCALPALRPAVLAHAMGWMTRRRQAALSEQGVLGYDDLLVALASALSGPRGARLAQVLRQQFPVVLVDEFQDTDPIQYQIFDSIYRIAENDPQTAVVLIGDPKQSIYGFRGADIHTYLAAARACAGRVQTLDRNFRSSQPMVQAVNACFSRRKDDGFLTGHWTPPIAFRPVQAQGLDERWQVHGTPQAALQASWIEPAEAGRFLTMAAYREAAAARCARRIAGLLALGEAGQAGFRTSDGLRAVRPADMAILVNTATEADRIRIALAQQGLRSVYLSERQSVYASPRAIELAICLQACLHPSDESRVRAALATPLLGLDIPQLARLVEDEHAWEVEMARFHDLHQCWQQRGVLPALRQLLFDFDVPARLLAQGTVGERDLTDCLHMAELLQQEAQRLDGASALLRYLIQQCSEPGVDVAEQRMRLESDDGLVRIVTIHKSKGLEYPLVFLPFICRPIRALSRAVPAGPWRLVQPDGERRWVLAPSAEAQAQKQQEALGEAVRQFYVALTRARHAVWMALGPVARQEESGVGHILGPDLSAGWQALMTACPDAVASADPLPGAASLPLAFESAPEPGPARRLARPAVRQRWWVSSYSALPVRDGPEDTLPADTADEAQLREARRAPPVLAPVDADPDAVDALALSSIPRGAAAGTFLHGLLEWAAQRQFRDLGGESARDLIARRCAVRGWEAHIEPLHAWLSAFAQTTWCPDLPGAPAWRLDRLQASLPEMEFWLPVERVDLKQLDALVSDAVLPGRMRPALAAGRLNGLFRGFVDLVVQSDGRYFVLDYKSNDLGPRQADYEPAALAGIMCAARYDVQLMMYLLALHRQLRARLPGYAYERHLGGAVFCFLRGQPAPGQGLFALRPSEAVMNRLDALFAAAPDPFGGVAS